MKRTRQRRRGEAGGEQGKGEERKGGEGDREGEEFLNLKNKYSQFMSVHNSILLLNCIVLN